MEGLAALGFWLGLGIFLAAGTVANGLKERDKEREKQATLRALLTAQGDRTPDILAYLREKDAAEEKRAHDQWVAMGGNISGRTWLAVLAAIVVGFFGFIMGLTALTHAPGKQSEPWLGLGLALGIWAASLLLAFLAYFLLRDRKNVPPPGV